jgi:hypothetical protein
LEHWLQQLSISNPQLSPASADASFRRYFRVAGSPGHIAVDAPPDTENNHAFVSMAQKLQALGLHVPAIIASDLDRGYLLVADLGNRSYLSELNPDNVEQLYGDALRALLTLQTAGPVDDELPRYDRAMLRRELGIFREWYLQAHLGLTLDAATEAVIDQTFTVLTDSALEQPQLCVHRDFHSRNLLITEHNNPGIIDFQDAVVGPLTYDLVSLLKDCYIAWPAERVEQWALAYQQLALQRGLLQHPDRQQFLRWFDLMGMQRHLKAIGIFARLYRRDGKHGYLADIPRTLGYVVEVAGRYPEFSAFASWLRRDLLLHV